MRKKVWLWRWRRNPLKRHSDVVEAWVALISVALMVIGGTAAGAAMERSASRSFAEQRAERHRTSAVLAKDAPAWSSAETQHDSYVNGTVRYRTPDGKVRTDTARVKADSEAGSRTVVWIDGRGRVQGRPPSSGLAAAEAATVGTATGLSFCALVMIGRRSVRVALDRRRLAEWERAWSETGPRWGPQDHKA